MLARRHAAAFLPALALALLAACSSGSNPPAASPAATPEAAASSTRAPEAAPAPASTPAATSTGESTEVAAASAGQSALERAAPLPTAGSLPAGRWVAGKHYRPLSPAQPTNVAPGKVEVVEVFWYGCPHCYALDPFLESWRKSAPSYVEFVRLPVMWQTAHKQHARIYYTLQALNAVDRLHGKVFSEVNQKHNPLIAETEEGSLKLQQAFAKANGISEKDYADAFNSFSVQTKLKQAEDLTLRYRVEGVPLIVINGKYVSDVGMAEGQANLISLINDLAAAEKRL